MKNMSEFAELVMGFGLGVIFCITCFKWDLYDKKVISIKEYNRLKKKRRVCKMTEKLDKRFGHICLEDDETEEQQWRTVRVMGAEYIFKILCLICRIMIYRLPVNDSIDRTRKDNFKKELDELIKGDDVND